MYVLCYLSVSYFFFLILRRPPRATRTDTLFPYTSLFRSYSYQQLSCIVPPGGGSNLDVSVTVGGQTSLIGNRLYLTVTPCFSFSPRKDRKSKRLNSSH